MISAQCFYPQARLLIDNFQHFCGSNVFTVIQFLGQGGHGPRRGFSPSGDQVALALSLHPLSEAKAKMIMRTSRFTVIWRGLRAFAAMSEG